MQAKAEMDPVLTMQFAAKLQAMIARLGGDASQVEVFVGFTADYALWVHENMEIWPPGMRLKGLPRGQGLYRDKDGVVRVPASVLSGGTVGGKHRGFYWDPQGKAQPKFLESAWRDLNNAGEFLRIMVRAMQGNATLATALLQCGLRLQREAQQRVPVDQGILKNSAFTRLSLSGSMAADAAAAEAAAEEGATP